ncbi:MAG TPA: DUF1259 domain-containing protein [Blastocatellia bacterium]|nr:DUF1259 domain-containing protein [Blastocatellia bacterium]
MAVGPINRRRFLGLIMAGAASRAVSSQRVEAMTGPSQRRGRTPPLSPAEIASVEEALGKKGRYVEEEAVYTIALPRNDLVVRIKGEDLPIPFGFAGWVSIKKTLDGRRAILMSDTVLREEEVNPLISSAQEQGLEVSALHNHFFYEEPRIFYLHLHGMGSVGELARRYATAIKATPLFPGNQPTPYPPQRLANEIFDLVALDRIVGFRGVVNGPTYKYTAGRADLTVRAMGAEITTTMGLNSWATLAGEPERAHIAGDIAMLEPEVNAVIRTLRRHNLEIVALHHHMLEEMPRIIFLHYYGRGPVEALVAGFRAALIELGRHKGHRRS